eukprot:2641170-Pyramimonas_sp.AAC.1
MHAHVVVDASMHARGHASQARRSSRDYRYCRLGFKGRLGLRGSLGLKCYLGILGLRSSWF